MGPRTEINNHGGGIMSSRKTKAELRAELKACKRENAILRDNLKSVLELNDAYLTDRNIIDAARRETIARLIPAIDDSTVLKNKTVKHSQDSAKGGRHEPLAAHKAALLELYKAEQQASKEHPNKTKLTNKYIQAHPELTDSFDALRKSLPKRKK